MNNEVSKKSNRKASLFSRVVALSFLLMYSEIHNSVVEINPEEIHIASMSIGAAVPSMTTAILNALQIVVPASDLRQHFDEAVSPMFGQCRILKHNHSDIYQYALRHAGRISVLRREAEF